MVSFEFPFNKKLVEMLFPRGFPPRKWNVEVGAVWIRVKSLLPAIASDLIDDAEEGVSIEFSIPCKTTILFKSWIN